MLANIGACRYPDKPIILFLNKKDLFEEKIKARAVIQVRLKFEFELKFK